VQLAISHVQGLLDLVLEISIDLSSTAPVIPSQGPGFVIPNQGPGSSKKTPPVELAVMSVNSHASLGDLVTSKLTGMANLALTSQGGGDRTVVKVEWGERDAYSLLAKGSLPLSCQASLLLIQSALEMFPTASTVEPVEFCDRNVGLESTDIPSGPSHSPSGALGTDLSPSSSAELAAVPRVVIPLSVRLGGLGHACHQAALTAARALAPSSNVSDVHSARLNRTSSIGSELVKLLLAVFEAYRRIARIDVEDELLTEAADAAELMLRGEASNNLPLPTSSSHKASRRGAGHSIDSGVVGTEGPGSPLSHRGRTGGRLRSSCLCRTQSSNGQTVSGDEGIALEDTEFDADLSQGIDAIESRQVSTSTGAHFSASYHASSALREQTLDRSLQHRESSQVEQSVNVGIPMSRLKNKTDFGPNWSDDSSEESDSDRSLDDDAQPIQRSRTVALSRVKSDPNDVLSRSVSLLPAALQDCLDRYDLPCNALKDYQREYDTASSGDTIGQIDTCRTYSCSARCRMRVYRIAHALSMSSCLPSVGKDTY
jgi:hypothetical protein